MIRDLRAWEYYFRTFVFHFLRVFFFLLSLHTHIRTHACISGDVHMCVYFYREGERRSFMRLIAHVCFRGGMCLFVRKVLTPLAQAKGGSFLMRDFRGS